MATVTTFQSASPYSLILSSTGNGAPPADTKTREQILAACVEGPLKVALNNTPDWTVFNLGGARCNEVHVREVVNRAANAPVTFEFFWLPAGAGVKTDCTGVCQMEIRLQHSERF